MDKKALIKALRDTVQSASNTVASGVSAPVDLIAAGLRKVGLPIPQAPVGGSQWMENMGLTVPVEEGIPKLAGETLGMIVPMAATAKAPQIAAAANRGLENLAAPRTLNTPGYGGQRGAIVWHGSPHKFEAFDASKIGTGEGAQAYGHGLYFAESPDVAKSYRDLLTKSDKQFYIKGKRVEPELLDSFQSNVLNAKGYGRNKQDYLDELEMNRVSSGAIQKISKIWDEMGDVTVKEVLPENASLYKVDLPDEAIARMLDWDKPLSQQAPDVQKAVESVMGKRAAAAEAQRVAMNAQYPGRTTHPVLSKIANKPRTAFDYKGEAAVSSLVQELGGPAKAASFLREQGIPGIRYLDQGSRATGGTSNFVVFPGEERLLRILERNGQPMGLMGAPKQTGAQATQTQRSAFVYPQQEALDIAQRNAAKPVSEGGLGLPPNNTAMDRAKAMGYPMDLYTSRHSPIGYVNKLPKPNTPIKNAEKIKAELEQLGIPVRGEQSGTGSTYLSFPGNPYKIDPAYGGGTSVPIEQMRFSTHSKRADKIPINQPDDQFVADVFPKYGNSLNEARSAIQSMIEKGGIRSRFAAFDPARINESDLLGYADPRLLGLLGLGTAGGIGAYNYMQGK